MAKEDDSKVDPAIHMVVDGNTWDYIEGKLSTDALDLLDVYGLDPEEYHISEPVRINKDAFRRVWAATKLPEPRDFLVRPA